MKINKFTYTKPDSDGDVRLEGSAVFENKTDFDAEYVVISTTVLNHAGVTVAGQKREEENAFVSSKGSEEMDIDFGWNLHEDFLDGKSDKISALVTATMYKREFVKVGSIEVPANQNSLNMFKKDVSLGGMVEVRGVSVLRKKDEDGEIKLEIRAGFRNVSDSYIDRAQLTTKLIDQRDAEIDESLEYQSMPSKSSWIAEPSFWGVKPGKVKNAELKLSASIFVPIGTFTAEASATLHKD